MSIDMGGHIDLVFESVPATRSAMIGSFVDGIWTETLGVPVPYAVNIQPASDQEIDFLVQGGERITDVRRIYVNDGDIEVIDNKGQWNFLGLSWKTVKCDNRPWNNYCKLLVVRIDDQ